MIYVGMGEDDYEEDLFLEKWTKKWLRFQIF